MDDLAAELAALRREVGTFRMAEQRRRFPVVLHVGTPGGPRRSWEVPRVPGGLDPAAAFDLVDAALADAAHDQLRAWLTRPGVPTLHEQDLLWLGATEAVAASRGATLLTFHAVTRTGWLDVRSGESRVWKRLRLLR